MRNKIVDHSNEINSGERFEFGKNWHSFLSSINDERIEEAENSLKDIFNLSNLEGKKFLDAGSGSGLFSLAARRLGAEVYSFDFDPISVKCTRELKNIFFKNDTEWVIDEGSVLDEEYLESLGFFDLIYSWGVLHHTGDMYKGLNNIKNLIKSEGVIAIAIYNDQDISSEFWKIVKRFYCSNNLMRFIVLAIFVPFFTLQSILIGVVKYRNPIGHFINYKKKRGMSIYYDWIDWLGGYPFEVAKPEEIIDYFQKNNFSLSALITTNRLGCNQFTFKKKIKSV
ncbi:class I SAM-dependent methyltransferase [Candidatus Pseudothioglobus singularis]|nr:class I SAM-dependent methyltransferase [Candidatus Pseudothioglobus singularis]MDB4822459.1 class I SAM-dependent methyltransferase [Candidatus Pseudothioglobus singularis]